MDLDTILKICGILKLNSTNPRDGNEEIGPQISISCPLSLINHRDSEDSNCSCSVSISDDDISKVRCFSGSCGFKGSFTSMLRYRLQKYPNQELQNILDTASEAERGTPESKVLRNRKIIEKDAQEQQSIVHDKDIFPERMLERFSPEYHEYAKTRGITEDTYKRWSLMFDKRNQRLVFPIRNKFGKLVGMQGRDVTGLNERPHHNYEGFNRQKYLLGEHLLIQKKPIIIVEGSTGCVKTDQNLSQEAQTVAVLGEGFSKFHAETICEFNPETVYIFCDGDAAGRQIASKIEHLLHGRLPLKVMESPIDTNSDGYKLYDPGNIEEEKAKFLFKTALPVLDKIRWTQDLPS